MNPGKCTVTAHPPFPSYEAQAQEVTLTSGETKTVDFYLDFERTVVHGHVYDQDGKAIAGAILSGVRSGKDMETAVTDEKGYFKFERASPGNLLSESMPQTIWDRFRISLPERKRRQS